MDKTMTLEQVRAILEEWGNVPMANVHMPSLYLRRMRDAIDAHLTQPAQVVDVGNWLWGRLMDWCKAQRIAPATQNQLFALVEQAREQFPARALSTEKAGRVGDVGAFRMCYSEVIRALAAIVNCPQTDAQCDAEVIPRDPVMREVMRVREAMDKITRALSTEKSGWVGKGWTRAETKLSERKTVHEWLNDLDIEREEFHKPICLLRRLRILCDRYEDTCAQLSFEIRKQAGWISVNDRRPERNKPAIYWHASEHGGFAAIADEWRDEHHLAHASHWMSYTAPASPTPDKEG